MSRRRLILRAIHGLQLYRVSCFIDLRMSIVRSSCARLRIIYSKNIIFIFRVDPLRYHDLCI